ncbi:MAG: pilus assembly protein PilM [Candidatus Desulfofervidaceae bacterium]|nr:pilus assembly protein PilM [Candidatus Desulfofervidaceae bacterium]
MDIFSGFRTLLKPVSVNAFLKGLFNRPLVGVDLGYHTIKVLRFKNKQLELADFGTYVLPEEAITEPDKRDEYLISALGILVDQLQLKQKEVAVCLPSKYVIMKKIELPPMKESELVSALFTEAEQYIPYDLKEVNLSYQVLMKQGEEKEKIQILIAAAKKDVIEKHVNLLKEAGLIPYVMDVENLALANAYEVCYGKTETPIALVDIGASSIKILVLMDSIPVFSREVSTGGLYLTRQIQTRLNLSFTEAERIKIEGSSDETVNGIVRDILVFVTTEWVNEIKTALDFFEGNSGTKINKIFVCGGSSRIKKLNEVLAKYLKKEIYDFNIFGNVKYNPNLFDPAYLDYFNPQAPVAFGLALRTKVEK